MLVFGRDVPCRRCGGSGAMRYVKGELRRELGETARRYFAGGREPGVVPCPAGCDQGVVHRG